MDNALIDLALDFFLTKRIIHGYCDQRNHLSYSEAGETKGSHVKLSTYTKMCINTYNVKEIHI